jgi:hypothetical protein
MSVLNTIRQKAEAALVEAKVEVRDYVVELETSLLAHKIAVGIAAAACAVLGWVVGRYL